jgi:hypothetical protein
MSADFLIYFRPQLDITAYELAVIVSKISGGYPPRHGLTISQFNWDEMSEGEKRHFSKEPPP